MRRFMYVAAIAIAVATPLAAQQQQGSANLGVSAARVNFMQGHTYVLRAAEQVPDSLYAFKPVASVRTLGQLFAHVAGSERMFCAMVLGDKPTAEDNIEKNKTAKADIVQALKESATYCEKAYALADANASATINVFGQPMTKVATLTMNATHDWEHYGNIVTYMRIKGLVPPSSQQ